MTNAAKDVTKPDANALPAALSSLPLTLSVRIGQARMSLRELTALGEGSLIALDARADAPLEICIEDRVVAYGTLGEAEDGALAVTLTETVG